MYYEQGASPAEVAVMGHVFDEVRGALPAGKRLAVELGPIQSFYEAEEYHQDYLVKNPGGYCHVDFSSLDELEVELERVAAS